MDDAFARGIVEARREMRHRRKIDDRIQDAEKMIARSHVDHIGSTAISTTVATAITSTSVAATIAGRIAISG